MTFLSANWPWLLAAALGALVVAGLLRWFGMNRQADDDEADKWGGI